MHLRLAGAALLALGTLAGTATVAEARDGCGPGFHRGYYGYCRPNLYGPRWGWRPAYGPRWRPAYGPRWHYGWHRPHWGGWHHAGWRGGWHHRPWGGWHHRW